MATKGTMRLFVKACVIGVFFGTHVKSASVGECMSKRCKPDPHPDVNNGQPVTRCQPGGWNNGCKWFVTGVTVGTKCCGKPENGCEGAGTFLGDRFWDINGDGKIDHNWGTSPDCGQCCGNITRFLPGGSLSKCTTACVGVGNPWNGNHGGIQGCIHACEWMVAHAHSVSPTVSPTMLPSTSSPTVPPSESPTRHPTNQPTLAPSHLPTTGTPSQTPTAMPTRHICNTSNHFCDTKFGICYEISGGGANDFFCSCVSPRVCLPDCKSPSHTCVLPPTVSPTNAPTSLPSMIPSAPPTRLPTQYPSQFPTSFPTTSVPTVSPLTSTPTTSPSHYYEIFVEDETLGVTIECTTHAQCNKTSYCALDNDSADGGALPFCRPCVEGTGRGAIGCNDYQDAIDGVCPSQGRRLMECNPAGFVPTTAAMNTTTSSGSKSSSQSTAGGEVVMIASSVAVIVVILLLVIIGACFVIRRTTASDKSAERTTFDNPMYESEVVASDTNPSSDVRGSSTAGYMDIPVVQSSGYMDVSATTPSDDAFAGFDDDQEDEEDV